MHLKWLKPSRLNNHNVSIAGKRGFLGGLFSLLKEIDIIIYTFDKMSELTSNIDQVKRICFGNKVKSLFAFGSIITDNFNDDSDVDLVVEISEEDPLNYSDIYFKLKFQLEQLFKRKVDLLEKKAIKNSNLKDQIEKTKVLIYAE